VAAGADLNARITDTTSFTARIARTSDMTDRTGQTALHAAAKQGWVSVFEYLLQQGLDPKAVDNKGHTTLDCANRVCGGREGAPTDLNVKMAAYVKGLDLGIEATRELSKN
jgi:ankyrin repeat protein